MKRFNFSEWSITHQALVLFMIILLGAAGVYSYVNLGRAEDPNFTIKVMVIGVGWPGATADEDLVITHSVACRDLIGCLLIRFAERQPNRGWIMAKRKKGSTRKAARAKVTKRTVAKAKPQGAPVKKTARRIKQPVVAAVETVVVKVVEQPVAVTEIAETEVRKAS